MPGELPMSKIEEFKEELKKLEEEVNKKYVGGLVIDIFKEKEEKRIREEIIAKFQDLIDKYYNNSLLKKRYKVVSYRAVSALYIDTVDPDTGKPVRFLEEAINED
jgi:hypothetical protein